jgi:branched-chain amino acid transport system permease protein
VRRAAPVVILLLLLLYPYQLDGFWIDVGLFSMAAAIAAIGLTLLVGITGQLSLGHMFFVAIGAYGFSYLSGEKPAAGLISDQPNGLDLPAWIAAVAAVGVAGIAGAAFSPIAGRLRGIYLGLASLGLVFIGQHLLLNMRDVTGGFNGRVVEPFSLFGFSFSDSDPDSLDVLGVAYGRQERLWYLGLLLVAVSWWLARNIINSRPGRALQAVRDSEIAASAMGIDVRIYKAAAFTISSMFAALGGVFLALTYESIVPESFGFLQSIDFLVMIVLGGLGSIGGAIAGAILVTSLPLIFDHFSDSLPLVADPGEGGLQSGDAARFIYGAAVILVLIFAPRGLAGLMPRRQKQRPPKAPHTPTVTTTKESTA